MAKVYTILPKKLVKPIIMSIFASWDEDYLTK